MSTEKTTDRKKTEETPKHPFPHPAKYQDGGRAADETDAPPEPGQDARKPEHDRH